MAQQSVWQTGLCNKKRISDISEKNRFCIVFVAFDNLYESECLIIEKIMTFDKNVGWTMSHLFTTGNYF